MTDTPLFMTLRPYDYVAPLLLGDVALEGSRPNFDWKAPLTIEFPDHLDGAEVSFNRYVLACARGRQDLVGIPAFILRGFRHRNFFVLADSPLTRLDQLKGRRLATNSWSDTGTLWARAAMRDAGVGVDDVEWTVGRVDDATPSRPLYAGDLTPPEGAHRLPEGDTLMAALLEGRIDAVTTAFAPHEIFSSGGRVRRLVTDYSSVEREYFQRSGVFPAFHIVAFRKSYALNHPQVVVEVCRALRQSWDIWWLKARRFAESSPWAMADFETMGREFAEDTPPFGRGSESHRRMLRAMCEEQAEQGLVAEAADPEKLFSGFDEVLQSLGIDEADAFTPRNPAAPSKRRL